MAVGGVDFGDGDGDPVDFAEVELGVEQGVEGDVAGVLVAGAQGTAVGDGEAFEEVAGAVVVVPENFIVPEADDEVVAGVAGGDERVLASVEDVFTRSEEADGEGVEGDGVVFDVERLGGLVDVGGLAGVEGADGVPGGAGCREVSERVMDNQRARRAC